MVAHSYPGHLFTVQGVYQGIRQKTSSYRRRKGRRLRVRFTLGVNKAKLQQIEVLRAGDSLEAIGHLKLPVDVLNVSLDGGHRDD